jgi:hypothetical protein
MGSPFCYTCQVGPRFGKIWLNLWSGNDGMVQAWVAQKTCKHDILQVFLKAFLRRPVSDFINILSDYW